jgi:dihydrofolate reductase
MCRCPWTVSWPARTSGRQSYGGRRRAAACMDGREGPDREIDLSVHREVDASVGATVIGRRTFDVGVGPWGGTPWPGVPSFIVTHRTRQDLLGDSGGRFAFDGLEAAVWRAKQAAGDKDVLVLGADVARQLLKAGLLDEVRIHLVPLLMREGTPLFAGERAELIPAGKPVTGSRDPSALPRHQAVAPRRCQFSSTFRHLMIITCCPHAPITASGRCRCTGVAPPPSRCRA